MRERSIGSWWRRFGERRAFQQTQVGLSRGFRAMHKVLSQMLDGDLGEAWPCRRAVRDRAEGGQKTTGERRAARRNWPGRTAEGRRRPCGATRAAKGGQKQAGS
jgi:hypothetical protein